MIQSIFGNERRITLVDKINNLDDIKLVALDIDGTLIDDNLKLTDRTRDKLIDLINRDIHVALVTGRPFRAGKLIRDKIDNGIPMVAYNGGIVNINGENIFSSKIPLDRTLEIIKYGEKYHLYVKVYIDDVLHIREPDEVSLRFSKNHDLEYKVVGKLSENIDRDSNMIIIYYGKEIHGEIDEEIKDIDVHITTSASSSIDVVPRDVSKGKGLKMIADYYNIKPENILAIGNSLNDLDMLQYAGIGIAMKNSDISLLSKWDNISEYTNNEEGVYHILKYL